MTVDIAVLVSIGRHPVSGRARRAQADAQALTLGLQLATAHGAHLEVVHAGDPDAGVLREYLGMGIETLRVLHVQPQCDPLPALVRWLDVHRPALVLTGTRTEAGWSSGSVPYALAAAVEGFALVPAAVALTLDARSTEILQALPRGQRRALRAMLPVIVTVDRAAPPARQSAYARARRGRIVVSAPVGPGAAVPDYGVACPARARPKRLRAAAGRSAAERLRALTTGPQHAARVVDGASPADAAQQICTFLNERGLLQQRGGSASSDGETYELAREG